MPDDSDAPDIATLTVVEHPLIEHKLSLVRDRRTAHERMRGLVADIALLMTVHATRGLRGEEVAVRTPLEATTARRIREEDLAVVSILRAGLGMAEGVLRIVPGARVGHLGFYRDEKTLEPVRYYDKIPPRPERLLFLLLDPMLATGGTAVAAMSDLKERGAGGIVFMCLIASPEGAARAAAAHPDVPVYAAALDRGLDERGYIVPGMGDAGDRLTGTF